MGSRLAARMGGRVDAEDDSYTDGDAKASATDRAKCEPMLVECLADIFRVICSGASMGISTVSKPHFLNLGKRLVDFVVNGEVNRKELMPNLITCGYVGKATGMETGMRAASDF